MESAAPSNTATYAQYAHAGADDYNTPHDTGMPAILAGILVPHALTTLLLLARAASRVLVRTWRASDTLILLAWAASTIICVTYGIAAYTPDILLAPSEEALQEDVGAGAVHPYILRTYLVLVAYQLCLCFTKLSVLAFYLGVFGARGRRVVWGSIAFVICYGVALFFLSIFQCHPQNGEFFSRQMTCIPLRPLLVSSAALHAAAVVWIIGMAAHLLPRLRMPYRQKVALAIVLSLGIFVVAAGLLRLQLGLRRDFGPGSVGVTNTLAFFVMTVVECDVAIMCACAPTLKPVVRRVWRGFLGEDESLGDEESMGMGRVSYHGYPWTREATPIGRKSADIGGRVYGRGPGAQDTRGARPPGSAGTRRTVSRGGAESRPVSLGFEEFLLGITEHPIPAVPKRSRRATAPGDGLAGRWDRSQESFVLGVDDPRHSSWAPAGAHGARGSPSGATGADEGTSRGSESGAESPTGLLKEGGREF